MSENIDSINDILHMLDVLLRRQEDRWDEFYSDRSKPIPFFINLLDENLVEYVEKGSIVEIPNCWS